MKDKLSAIFGGATAVFVLVALLSYSLMRMEYALAEVCVCFAFAFLFAAWGAYFRPKYLRYVGFAFCLVGFALYLSDEVYTVTNVIAAIDVTSLSGAFLLSLTSAVLSVLFYAVFAGIEPTSSLIKK